MNDFVDYGSELYWGSQQIHWDISNKKELANGIESRFIAENQRVGIYRPFCKQWLYFDKQWNSRRYQQPRIFPTPDGKNLSICVSGIGAGKEFSALMVDAVPNQHFIDTCQCFPRFRYTSTEAKGRQAALGVCGGGGGGQSDGQHSR